MQNSFKNYFGITLLTLISFLVINLNLPAQEKNESVEKLKNLKGEIQKITFKTSEGEVTIEGKDAAKMFAKLKELKEKKEIRIIMDDDGEELSEHIRKEIHISKDSILSKVKKQMDCCVDGKMDKKVTVIMKDDETEIKVITKEDGKETIKVYTGKDAEEYLKKNGEKFPKKSEMRKD